MTSDISPTHGACVGGISDFSFIGKLDFRRASDPDFCIDEDLPLENLSEYRSLIRNLHPSFLDLSLQLYDDYSKNGNYFIELVHTEVNGVIDSKIYYHPVVNIHYSYTKLGKPQYVYISPYWTDKYLRENPPKEVAVYPNYSKRGNVLRTMIHCKEGNYRWYGRPDWSSAYMAIYREWQNNDHICKATYRHFMGEVLISEENEIKGSFTDDAKINREAEKSITMESDDPQTILFKSRPHGTLPPFIHEFTIKTDESWFNWSAEDARKQIYQANRWSERLLGQSVATGFSGDAFKSELEIKDITILEKVRERITKGINLAIRATQIVHQKNFEIELYFKSAMSKFKSESDFKTLVESYGIGVRAGTITPVKQDEIKFRNMFGIDPCDDCVNERWANNGGYETPITLKGMEEKIENDNT